MKTNLNIIYKGKYIRVFQLANDFFVVESVKNKIYKKRSSAIKRADQEDLRIEISKLFT